MAPEAWVWLARIRRPQGRKGEVFAELLTDFPEKFTDRRRLWLLPPKVSATGAGASCPSHSGTRETKPIDQHARQVDLINHWLHKGGIVLLFAGVDSISAAEALNGLIVAIPRAERAALPADEAYIGDLIGCMLVDVSGANPVSVGKIEDVELSAGRPMGTAPLLIPFAKSYLRRIDVAAKRLEMALPEGLIDLNAPEES